MDKKKTKRRVTFQLHAPGARNVCVAGSFNDWDALSLPLKQADGAEAHTWRRIMYLEPGDYQYRFVVDGLWCDDPLCEEKLDNEFGSCNSVLRVLKKKASAGKKKS
jgi:1,4-alpha-glucan branching enzyme